MSGRCTACNHPDRGAIDQALVRGLAVREVASLHGLTKSAVSRHQRDHLPASLVKAEEAEEVSRAEDLLAEIEALQTRTYSLLSQAEKAGELGVALRAVREARGNLELLARLRGELNEGTTVNVLISPQWVEVRALILTAPDPYPAARLAVAEALSRESGN